MSATEACDDERLALVRLTLVDGLGPIRLRKLLERFATALEVLAASKSALQSVDGIGPKIAEQILDPAGDEQAHADFELMRRHGAFLLHDRDDNYPVLLRELPDAPLLLRARGTLVPEDQRAIAVVGSRRCSEYGRQQAGRLAAQLAARGFTIVSGLARGIDAVAHESALRAGGRTLAVLASGLANIYPPEHVDLAESIVRQGALLSEAPMDGVPIGGLFPQRNRLVSGLTLGVVVVEAAAKSGALSTARHALEQNREVFALPGRVNDPASEGTNQLIRQGACLVTGIDDILEQLGPFETPVSKETPSAGAAPPSPAPVNLTDVQRRIWEAIEGDGVDLDLLIERTGLRASETTAQLLLLEMRRLVRRLPGNRFART